MVNIALVGRADTCLDKHEDNISCLGEKSFDAPICKSAAGCM